MVKFVKLINQVRKDEDGTALLEYAILIGIIAVAAIGWLTGLGGWVTNQFSGLCNAITAANAANGCISG